MSSKSIDSAPRSSISVASGVTSSSPSARAWPTASSTALSTSAISLPPPFSGHSQRLPDPHLGRDPAVDGDERSGHVAGPRRRQEDHDLRDLLHRRELSE